MFQPKSYKKYEQHIFFKKFIYKGIEKIIKPYKYVVLVGNFRIQTNENNVFYNVENIDTQNKYIIDIDHDVLLERRIKRHFKALHEYEDKYCKKLIKKVF